MTAIKTYLQDLPPDWIKRHPLEKWRCDIHADTGSHHGVGRTEAEAVFHAASHWHSNGLPREADRIEPGMSLDDYKALQEAPQ